MSGSKLGRLTSAARLNANRRNARVSTGPRSSRGKAIVAQNARKHGLAVPLSRDPSWQAAFRAQAHTLVGAEATQDQIALAADFIAADAEVDRVRRAMQQVISAYFEMYAVAERHSGMTGQRVQARIVRELQLSVLAHAGVIRTRLGPDGVTSFLLVEVPRNVSEEQFYVWAAGLCLQKLARLQEYHRKARGRRRKARQTLQAVMGPHVLSPIDVPVGLV